MNQFLYTAGFQDGYDCISSAVSLGDFVYVSMQTGNGETIEEQTITACNKMISVLSDLGLEMRHAVKFTVFLTDMEYKVEFLSIYKQFVEAPFPAVTLLEVKGLENNAKVGMEAFAINTIRYEKSNACCDHDCESCSGGCTNN